mmetsp:Transcript_15914/g.34568  ORF Transcript_15914/g.34568 Transcript_15914/m.34568 type:complete len:207 (+) Transcript_15914:190-810(+)|eukprot:CAMPEP_0178476410 /NCGR_PEP_ID=MMETSP0696-20121128/3611_1 /TAXON_ID=265572 /ORGANISM="Extubocellulus spinifer, Strain CCMP396" /LENGTH=206 /DNA_ID=CAMNT_0020103709 /DNA_START=81 /DNA_END=701 /DNA_ORIENTATION=+
MKFALLVLLLAARASGLLGFHPAETSPVRVGLVGVQNGNKRLRPPLTELRGGGGQLQPPIAKWSVPAGVCAICYASYNICIKKASSLIDPLLGGVLLQLVATVLGGCLWVATKSGHGSKVSQAGMAWSVAAGIAVGMAEILSFYVNSLGVPASQSVPVIIGGSILVGCVMGFVFLRELLTLRGWCGVLLIALGIAMVGMDPGASLH